MKNSMIAPLLLLLSLSVICTGWQCNTTAVEELMPAAVEAEPTLAEKLALLVEIRDDGLIYIKTETHYIGGYDYGYNRTAWEEYMWDADVQQFLNQTDAAGNYRLGTDYDAFPYHTKNLSGPLFEITDMGDTDALLERRNRDAPQLVLVVSPHIGRRFSWHLVGEWQCYAPEMPESQWFKELFPDRPRHPWLGGNTIMLVMPGVPRDHFDWGGTVTPEGRDIAFPSERRQRLEWALEDYGDVYRPRLDEIEPWLERHVTEPMLGVLVRQDVTPEALGLIRNLFDTEVVDIDGTPRYLLRTIYYNTVRGTLHATGI